MPTDCRLIFDEPAPGAWNMAVDEALLESAADEGVATLRLYRWDGPTLSLGYFQAYADRAGHAASDGLPCVRRSSGGGALVHHHELTYSLALPPDAVTGRDTRALYCNAHRAIIETLDGLGMDTQRMTLCDPAAEAARADGDPFLCFLRRADGDLLVGGPQPDGLPPGVGGRHKVCGSAQRKRRGALLQHGGLLLERSDHAPELPGLRELALGMPAGADGSIDQGLIDPLVSRLSERLGLACQPGSLTDAETRRAERLVAEKHAHPDWVERR